MLIVRCASGVVVVVELCSAKGPGSNPHLSSCMRKLKFRDSMHGHHPLILLQYVLRLWPGKTVTNFNLSSNCGRAGQNKPHPHHTHTTPMALVDLFNGVLQTGRYHFSFSLYSVLIGYIYYFRQNGGIFVANRNTTSAGSSIM